MSILQNTGVVFHDTANGGWYCNDCKRYIHHDMVPSHRYNHKYGLGVVGASPTHTKGESDTGVTA